MLSSVLSLILLGLATTSSVIALDVRDETATIFNRAVTVKSWTTSSSAKTTTSTTIPKPVVATFPEFGPEQGITGTLTFTPAHGGVGVVITSTGETALQHFPAGKGPFLYHSNTPPHRFARLML